MINLKTLEQARRELIDQGLRNPFINYRIKSIKGVEVIDERPADIFQLLVRDGKSLDFLHDPSKESQEVGIFIDDPIPFEPTWFLPQIKDVSIYLLLKFQFVERVDVALEQPDESRFGQDDARFRDSHLQTPYSSQNLQRRLLETYEFARTILEEQGVNVLYIVLGELKWYEADNAQETRRAPLVMVPVEISRRNAQARFTVRYLETGVSGNIALREKLRSEWHLQMPMIEEMFEEETEIDLDAYYDKVAEVIHVRPRWMIDREAISVGFFSFGKSLMYNDLSEDAWPDHAKPSNHPILSALLGEGFPGEMLHVDPLTADTLDAYQSHHKNSHILDADSSQTEAIYAVKKRKTIAIQGPPGTGKSQTIANIITEAVGDGLTVLFVAEKLAALEVVKRRLDAAQVGDLCLELHSHKSKRKTVFAELQRTLDLAPLDNLERDKGTDDHQRLREQLNAYSRAVGQKVGKTGVTPYDAYGQLLLLQDKLKLADVSAWEQARVKDWSSADYENALQQVQRLQRLLQKFPSSLAHHPFLGVQLTAVTPSLRDDIARGAGAVYEGLIDAIENLKNLSLSLGTTTPSTLLSGTTLARIILAWRSVRSISIDDLTSEDWLRRSVKRLKELIEVLKEFQQSWDSLKASFRPEALETDLSPLRLALQDSQSWFKRLMGANKRVETEFFHLTVTLPTPDQRPTLLEQLEAAQRLKRQITSESDFATRLLGEAWEGHRTELSDLQTVLDALETCQKLAVTNDLSRLVLEGMSLWSVTSENKRTAQAFIDQCQVLDTRFNQLVNSMKFDVAQRFSQLGYEGEEFTVLLGLLRQWKENTEDLNDIIQVFHVKRAMDELGISDLFQVAKAWLGAAKHLEDIFNRNWYEQIIRKALDERSELREFDAIEHNERVVKFRQRDGAILSHNKLRVIQRHTQQVQDLSRSGVGQVGLLRSELTRKRGQKSIRRLLADAPNAVQKLKPVFMMSPMSVASFLEPGKISFDVVVFDEASQIRPADALGSILRGQQVVVVGDSKQLPPTSFFDSIGGVDDEDQEGQLSDYESILGLFNSRGVKNYMLRWHYRSKHESLIAVSNQEFYESRLLIPPSAIADAPDLGLKYRYLPETYYERGNRINQGEAEAVAKAVIEHAQTSPDITLGVAAFSQSQMQIIRDKLEELRRKHPELEESFFNRHLDEPFFIKNLENVQGDERDVIFISIGYGKTRDGRLYMNFGPLNRDGGERRLNVLTTRARLMCVVFTNLRADDMDVSTTNSTGVRSLKTFLRYAETGSLDLISPTGREADSPFETSVATKLRELGYTIHHQIGTAGFFIDLAVVDEQNPGSYLVGVECDGASYHRSASARDRDRLRQAILESKGWRILRVWSTDWFNRPTRELERLKSEIEAARSQRNANQVIRPLLGEAELEVVRQQSIRKIDTASRISVPYQLAESQTAKAQSIAQVSYEHLRRLIYEVLEVESPIHIDELIRRIARALGFGRVGREIRQAVLEAIRQAAVSEMRGDFVYIVPEREIIPRDRSAIPAESRNFEFVAPEEIRACVFTIVKMALGDVSLADLVRETREALGFRRSGKEIETTISTQIQVMVNLGILVERAPSVFHHKH